MRFHDRSRCCSTAVALPFDVARPAHRTRLFIAQTVLLTVCWLGHSVLAAFGAPADPLGALGIRRAAGDDNGPSVSIMQPGYNDQLRDTVQVLIAIQTRKYNPQTVEMFVDDRSATNGPVRIDSLMLPSAAFEWNTKLFTDGPHKLTVRVTDTQGFIGASDVTVYINNKKVVDTTPPGLTWLNVGQGDTLHGVVNIHLKAVDNFGVKFIIVALNSSRTPNRKPPLRSWFLNRAPYTVSFDTRNLTDGSYLLSALAYDALENEGEAPALQINISNYAINPVYINPPVKRSEQGTLPVPQAPAGVPGTTRPALSQGSRPQMPQAPPVVAAAPPTRTASPPAYDAVPAAPAPDTGTAALVAPPVSGSATAPSANEPGGSRPTDGTTVAAPPAAETPATGTPAAGAPRLGTAVPPRREGARVPEAPPAAFGPPPGPVGATPRTTEPTRLSGLPSIPNPQIPTGEQHPATAPAAAAATRVAASVVAESSEPAAPAMKAVDRLLARLDHAGVVSTPDLNLRPVPLGSAVLSLARGAEAAARLADSAAALTAERATYTDSRAMMAALTAPAARPRTLPGQPTRAGSQLAALTELLGAPAAQPAARLPLGSYEVRSTQPAAGERFAGIAGARAGTSVAPRTTVLASAGTAPPAGPLAAPAHVEPRVATLSTEPAGARLIRRRTISAVTGVLSRVRGAGDALLAAGGIATPSRLAERPAVVDSQMSRPVGRPRSLHALEPARVSLAAAPGDAWMSGARRPDAAGTMAGNQAAGRRLATSAPTPRTRAAGGRAAGNRGAARQNMTAVSGLAGSRVASRIGAAWPAAATTTRVHVPHAALPRLVALPGAVEPGMARAAAAIVVAPATPAAPMLLPTTYVTRRDEALTAIAARFKVPATLLAASNNMTASGRVPAGRTVRLPQPLLVTYHGKAVTGDVGSLMVGSTGVTPFRFLFERQGGTLAWDGKKQQVTARNAAHEVTLTIGSRAAVVNNKEVMMDLAAFLLSGRTMVPIRLFEKALRAQVEWEPSSGRLYVAMAN